MLAAGHGPGDRARALERLAAARSHARARDDRALEGALFVDDGKQHELGPRGAHFVPRGTGHSFANRADEPARALFVCTLGGLERFFHDIATARSDNDVAAAAERAGLVFG